MIRVSVGALKLNFKRDELPGLSRLVIMGRMKRAMERKWISREQADKVTSVWTGKRRSIDFHYIFLVPEINTEKHLPNRPETI